MRISNRWLTSNPMSVVTVFALYLKRYFQSVESSARAALASATAPASFTHGFAGGGPATVGCVNSAHRAFA